MTRKEFLLGLGSASALPRAAQPGARRPKVILIVAHPDDEYTFAATVYRIARELPGIVDQVVVTNGEAGYRYSSLAERYYNASLTNEAVGRARLPEIRRRETLAAGKVLGIRRHSFLNQKDGGYTLDPADAFRLWNTDGVTREIAALLERERYDFAFTLLPASDTHGHHKAATILALRAVARAPLNARPVVLAADPALASDPIRPYSALALYPDTAPLSGAPVFRIDRTARFGFHGSLTYQIVVNWVIAEHKSQGLFQTEYNRFDEERFWLFERNPSDAIEKTRSLFDALRPANR